MKKGIKHSEETKRKISFAMKGEKNPMFGRSRKGEIHKRGYKHSEQSKKNMREGQAKRFAKSEMYGSFKGRKHSEETKRKMSESAKKRKKRLFSKQARENIGKAVAEGFVNGSRNYSPNKCYRHSRFWSEKNQKNLWYRSSLELQFYDELEKSPIIKKFVPEPMLIPYMNPEKEMICHYVPDLLVTFIDESMKLVEIKPKFDKINPVNCAKFMAARYWVKENNMTFAVWTEEVVS